VDRLSEHDAPTADTPLQEVVEAPGADDVALHPVDLGTLGDRHLGLGDGAVSGQVDCGPAEEMKDADPALEALAADPDELEGRSLKPGGHHDAVVVPEAREALPVPGVAPQGPVLDQIPD